jgi:hypothetical protein
MIVVMPKRSSEKGDFMRAAHEVVEPAIGEHIDGTPLEREEDDRNPHAVALGKIGGKKGGAARATAKTTENTANPLFFA